MKQKHILIIAIITTLATVIRSGSWGSGFFGGTGRGFPIPFLITSIRSDLMGQEPRGQELLTAAVFCLLGLIADAIFWFAMLNIARAALQLGRYILRR
jgi:hypothetical protein